MRKGDTGMAHPARINNVAPDAPSAPPSTGAPRHFRLSDRCVPWLVARTPTSFAW